MVGIVLVSHSRPLALAVQELVKSMTGPELPLAVAAGAGENHGELGTDAMEISEAILSVKGAEGVLVLMDMGSAILSSETALDLMEEKDRAEIRFCAAPFVEGAVAAGVTAHLGSSLDEVCAEALAALHPKESALSEESQTGAASSAVPPATTVSGDGPPSLSIRLTIHHAHGLHARPAARLILETRPFRSEITIRNLSNRRGPVSVKSLSRLASLEIAEGHEIEISAVGEDAAAALEKISELVRKGFGEPSPALSSPILSSPTQPEKDSLPLPISNGIAVGPGVYFATADFEIPQDRVENGAVEISRLREALAVTQKELEARRVEMKARIGADHANIYQAQILALQDPELVDQAIHLISDERKNAALAWSEANQQIVDRYAALDDAYLRERAADIKDVGSQVLEKLGAKKATAFSLTEPSILIAEDLSPNQVSSLQKDRVLGVILLGGGPTAHSSILLKALGLPAMVQARSAFKGREMSRLGLVGFDGATGKIWLNPAPDVVRQLLLSQADQRSRVMREKEAALRPAVTLDGHLIQVHANIGHAAETREVAALGAEGIGLLRTEFLFLDRETAPTESEQIEILRKIADEMGDRPVVVRTLDVGGDKPLPYLPMPAESNPFLGVRALRLCFSHEEIFTTQLRAILQAGHGHDFRIMFPMVADLADLERARACLDKAHENLKKENLPHRWPIQTGIMIEIPSAALQMESLAARVDFFSVGTNDLTQYTLAADRGNPALSSYQDALHPALLRLIERVVAGARQHRRPVAICGEAAADEISALIFVGLGVEELSMSAARIPRIKAILRTVKSDVLQELARKSLSCDSAAQVRRLAGQTLKGTLQTFES